MKLEDVIRSKGTSVVTIEPQASVIALVTLMADNNIGAVVVSADGVHWTTLALDALGGRLAVARDQLPAGGVVQIVPGDGSPALTVELK